MREIEKWNQPKKCTDSSEREKKKILKCHFFSISHPFLIISTISYFISYFLFLLVSVISPLSISLTSSIISPSSSPSFSQSIFISSTISNILSHNQSSSNNTTKSSSKRREDDQNNNNNSKSNHLIISTISFIPHSPLISSIQELSSSNQPPNNNQILLSSHVSHNLPSPSTNNEITNLFKSPLSSFDSTCSRNEMRSEMRWLDEGEEMNCLFKCDISNHQVFIFWERW